MTLRGSRERARKNASPLGKLWGFAGLQGGSEIQMLRHKTITSMCSQLANTMQQWATLVLHPNPMKHMSKATLRKKRAFCAIWRPKATRYIKKTSTLTVFSLTICSNAIRTKYPEDDLTTNNITEGCFCKWVPVSFVSEVHIDDVQSRASLLIVSWWRWRAKQRSGDPTKTARRTTERERTRTEAGQLKHLLCGN